MTRILADFVRVEKEATIPSLLASGKTIFLPTTRAGGYYAMMRRKGYRVHQQATTVDGVKGVAVWADHE